jgi:hypothetical protein
MREEAHDVHLRVATSRLRVLLRHVEVLLCCVLLFAQSHGRFVIIVIILADECLQKMIGKFLAAKFFTRIVKLCP